MAPIEVHSRMDIDQYFASIQTLATASIEHSIEPQDLRDSAGRWAGIFDECVQFRSELINSAEEASLEGYLAIGLFPDAPEHLRRASFAVCLEVSNAASVMALERQCERYADYQPLFKGAPALLSAIRRRHGNGGPDNELVDCSALIPIPGSEIYQLPGGGYGKLVNLLNPAIAEWARGSLSASGVFIRLDPYEFHTDKPRQYLAEAVVVPGNWRQLDALRPRMRVSSVYALEDCEPTVDLAPFWDYRVRGIRRLEVQVNRKKLDYISMMLEELSRPNGMEGPLIGRCIHLDSRDPADTPVADIHLEHLDLAINVYNGNTGTERLKQNYHDSPKVVDASFRTHLLRVENAPFSSLFAFAAMYLRSRVLLRDWISDIARSF